MSKYFYILPVFALLAIGGFGGFRFGAYWQKSLDEDNAVQNHAAHWNPNSKQFTWGSAELSNLVQLDPDDLLKPLHKPVHP